MGFLSLLLFLMGFILLASVSGILILLTALKARSSRDREMSSSSSSFHNRLNALICASTAAAASPDFCPASLCYQKLRIVRYKRRKPEEEEVVDCSFCLCGIEEWQEIRELRCEHLFHRDCLDKWIQQPRNSCPICRCSLLS